ncbi:GNAT family N-acetyltransferase [Kallotenue papyrolyticum]|uniref:GNAT family N-acetyltransferase n=1 Tax=Kallotenue papyrolyticum TaxID=1325125 RepID=UPI00047867B4|nr:GNAT family N-acetyltransferase [Kallotenue papyrolyticum]
MAHQPTQSGASSAPQAQTPNPGADASGFALRPATRSDAGAIADLLLEGFGHEYGGWLHRRAGRRFIERIHTLPGRLYGLLVAVDSANRPIGVAGLRTREVHPRSDGLEERMLFEELGVGRALLLDLRAALTEPPMYQPRSHEAYIYSVAVTAAWRRRGVASALLTALHDRARSYGKTSVLLEVAANNQAACRLYLHHGYVVVGRRRGLLGWLPLGAPTHLLMHKEL